MSDITDIFAILAKGIIYLGGVFVAVCIVLGAITLWQLFTTTLFAIRLATKWEAYRLLSPEAKEEFLNKHEPQTNDEQQKEAKNRKP